MSSGVDPVRAAAVDVLVRVFEAGAYLKQALDISLRRHPVSSRGRRFLTQLVYGTVRHKLLADYILSKLLHQPLDKLPGPIRAILRMGVYEALFLQQVPFPAMVHTSVDLARRFGHAGTARLVNAILRRVPKSLDAVELPPRAAGVAAHLSVRHSLPLWLVAGWLDAFGEEGAEALCAASNTEAPVAIRANVLRNSAGELAALLSEKGFKIEKKTPVPEELTIVDGPPPAQSKLFDEGLYLVQDAASMLPPHLLEPKAGERILDLCAAPGSKTTHVAALMEGRGRVTAVDIHPGKLGLVLENAGRLGLGNIGAVCADGSAPPFGEVFDGVLVDAPCSGLGTLRRHPDLKWRVHEDTPRRLQEQQVALLRAAIRLCKMNGLVVYSVCTFSREETEEVARAIFASEAVRPEDGPEWLDPWKVDVGQYRILPEKEGLDGFFLMRLRKAS